MPMCPAPASSCLRDGNFCPCRIKREAIDSDNFKLPLCSLTLLPFSSTEIISNIPLVGIFLCYICVFKIQNLDQELACYVHMFRAVRGIWSAHEINSQVYLKVWTFTKPIASSFSMKHMYWIKVPAYSIFYTWFCIYVELNCRLYIWY